MRRLAHRDPSRSPAALPRARRPAFRSSVQSRPRIVLACTGWHCAPHSLPRCAVATHCHGLPSYLRLSMYAHGIGAPGLRILHLRSRSPRFHPAAPESAEPAVLRLPIVPRSESCRSIHSAWRLPIRSGPACQYFQLRRAAGLIREPRSGAPVATVTREKHHSASGIAPSTESLGAPPWHRSRRDRE